jgi:hypothetical protein
VLGALARLLCNFRELGSD